LDGTKDIQTIKNSLPLTNAGSFPEQVKEEDLRGNVENGC